MIKYKSKRGVFDALLIKALGVEYIKFVISLSGKLRIESYSKEMVHFYPSMYVNIPTGRALAFSWVYWVWIKDIKARKCKAKDCHKIFISVRSDQEYCSKRCAKRVWAQKNILER